MFSSQAEWAVPISLVLGPSDGISYQTQNSTTVNSDDICSLLMVLILVNKNDSIRKCSLHYNYESQYR